jgi:glutamyl-tRNA reductase
VNFLVGGHIERFAVIGTNFIKADITTRSRFAITKPQADEIYKKAASHRLADFFILSTCNRTEFYASAPLDAVKELVSGYLELSVEDMQNYFYRMNGVEAVRHFFRVVAGLDSQIIGDYEIVCQVRAALDEARKFNLVGTISDRISNFAFQASKKIKAHTNLSNGKYSVSYAAAELMFHQKEYVVNKILLVGTGDFGSTVARNLRHYFPEVHLSLTNRTEEKAEKVVLPILVRFVSCPIP